MLTFVVPSVPITNLLILCLFPFCLHYRHLETPHYQMKNIPSNRTQKVQLFVQLHTNTAALPAIISSKAEKMTRLFWIICPGFLCLFVSDPLQWAQLCFSYCLLTIRSQQGCHFFSFSDYLFCWEVDVSSINISCNCISALWWEWVLDQISDTDVGLPPAVKDLECGL